MQFYQHQQSGTHHGPVNLSDTGAIDSYTVTQGKITIGDKGMDASTNYAALLADAIAINGTVTAANATLGAGNFTFDNNTGKMATLGKTATVMQMLIPEYSIDISNLAESRPIVSVWWVIL